MNKQAFAGNSVASLVFKCTAAELRAAGGILDAGPYAAVCAYLARHDRVVVAGTEAHAGTIVARPPYAPALRVQLSHAVPQDAELVVAVQLDPHALRASGLPCSPWVAAVERLSTP